MKKIIRVLLVVFVLIFALFLAFNKENNINDNQDDIVEVKPQYKDYYFRNDDLLETHFKKHGIEMGYENKFDYQKAASAVVNNKDSLHKIEKEDGDDVYYLEQTNEFVVVSTDGYIRTYFKPDSGIKYFNKQ